MNTCIHEFEFPFSGEQEITCVRCGTKYTYEEFEVYKRSMSYVNITEQRDPEKVDFISKF